MEVKILKEEKDAVLVEIGGETISFANLLRQESWTDKSTAEAAHMKEHPYLSQPKVFVKSSRGSPRTILEKTAERISDQAKEFKEEFKKALKK
ncbi:MAG TPA: RpoL/Rpb11 RNA polymerase subunit family protein [archaeon]|nr:RpoL/Rpb11 RNA polymerase subunit family protein [archaeon]